MRHIGFITSQQDADRFSDYLYSQGIPAQVEAEEGRFAIWVRDEDAVARSRTSLAEFQADPEADKYIAAVAEASRLRAEAVHRQQESRRTTVDVRREVWNRPATQRMPITIGMIVVCVIIALLTQFGDAGRDVGTREAGIGAQLYRALVFRDPLAGGDGWTSIRQGQLWRLLTPAFLHLGVVHLAFNMWCLYFFGGQIEVRRSWLLMLFILVATAVAGNIAQCFFHGPGFGGMSGAIYGLFGYVLVRQKIAPEEQLRVSSQNIFILLVWLVMGFTGALGAIANQAHLFGLLMGLAIAYVLPTTR